MRNFNLIKARKILCSLLKAGILVFLFTGLIVQGTFAQDSERGVIAEYLQNSENISLEDVRISVEFENTPLDEAIFQLGEKSGLKFNYNAKLFPNDANVTYQVGNAALADILDSILPSNVSYIAVRNIVILREKKEPQVPSEDFFQETVRGTVVDGSTGEALPGVNIFIQGTQRGTVTDVEGDFELEVESLDVTLIVTYIGYERQVVDVAGRTQLDIELTPGVVAGDELVVVGYGSVQRRDVTGAIDGVTSEQLEKANLTNIEEGLRGNSAGVRVVQTSGAPDSDMTIRIRGTNSALGGNSPLYVIDGLPVEGGLQKIIDPSSIESMEILKDASATAIYGSRGANGVVLITTKKGSVGSTMINFKTSIGMSEVTKKIDLLNAEQFAMLANEAAINDGRTPELDLNNLPGNDTDWQDEIFRRGANQNYNLSISGGTEETQYSFSTDIQNSKGIVKNSDFTRQIIRLNLNQVVNDWFSIDNHYTFGHSKGNEITGGIPGNIGPDAQRTTIGSALIASPLVQPLDANGNYTDIAPYNFINDDKEHPLILIREVLDETNSYSFLGNTKLNIDLSDNLMAGIRGGVDFRESTEGYYQTSKTFSGTSSGSQTKSTSMYWLLEGTLDYIAHLGRSHDISATGGFTLEEKNSNYLFGGGSDFPNENLLYYSLGSASTLDPPSNNETRWSIASLLGRINYKYQNKYLLTITGRYDGSSRLGKEQKWGFFPSVGLGWLLTEEDFISELDLFSILKLRAGWGIIGNQNIGSYNSLTRYTSTVGVIDNPTNRVIGFAPSSTVGNPNLTWEETRQFNIGLDIGLLNNRLNLSFDYYDKLTDDLLASASLAPSSGFQNTITNVGVVSNKGIELIADVILLQSSNMNLSVNTTFSKNQNNVESTNNQDQIFGASHGFTSPITVTMPGYPISSFWGFKKSDLLTDDGYVQFEDLNGDGNISENDKTIIGNPHPDFIYTFGTDFSYKSFYGNILFDGSYGNDIYNITKLMVNDSFSEGKNQTIEMLDRWSPDNPDRSARYPKLGTSSVSEGQGSDQWLEDGSYLKLRSVTFGFDLQGLLRNVGWSSLRSASVYVKGTNLITVTDYSWYDPEVNTFGDNDLSMGVERNTYPQSRSFVLGINIGL